MRKAKGLLAAAMLLVVCQTSTSRGASSDVVSTLSEKTALPAQASSSAGPAKSAAASPEIPREVEIYATRDVGAGQRCIVGARTDEDGMNEKPVAYLSNAKGGFSWEVSLSIPTDTYQGRATHCVASARTLFVLVQSDTQPQQSLSQTLLQVVELDRKSGAVLGSKSIDVPNISAAHTTWVEKGDKNFLPDGNDLVVRGRYEFISDRDNASKKEPSRFSVNVSQHHNP
ncbi:hypothetical protein [Dyella lipolytica]|uniref:Lipoprotein n=1 Tax=Dyella lipolytica TaxID=1867835 RepID=A0ABW8IZ75_9GAMM|nr:hypothetical protein [Dyella lipolytica]